MIVPDVLFICENMLMSEGFVSARALAHKFVTLYALCKTLLSEAMHYDWGLRAVKAVLRQAGSLKRADPNVNEDTLLMRALRDFNIAKITTEGAKDIPVESICRRPHRRGTGAKNKAVPHTLALYELARVTATVYNKAHQGRCTAGLYRFLKYVWCAIIYWNADKPIFLRLIEDLFPGVVSPPKRNADFWRVVMAVTKAQKLQCEEQFILKCVQVREALQVSCSLVDAAYRWARPATTRVRPGPRCTSL